MEFNSDREVTRLFFMVWYRYAYRSNIINLIWYSDFITNKSLAQYAIQKEVYIYVVFFYLTASTITRLDFNWDQMYLF